MKRRGGDPYWLTARYPGPCAKCGTEIKAGEQAFYYPNGKKLFGKTCGCGDAAQADFDAHAFDETNNRSL